MVEVEPLKDDRFRAYLSPEEYQLLIESAPHHRAKPPIRLMALSLRVGTAAEVTPDQIYRKNGEYFMRVEGKDPTDRYQETKPRSIWIPEPLYEEISQFIERQGIDKHTSICDVQKRQLQNWVDDATKNAATASGDNDFKKVSAHDLRRFFATHFLIRLGIDPQIVTQLGGWKSPEYMFEYLLFPNDLLVHHLTAQGYTGTNPLHISGIDPIGELNANFDAIEKILSQEGDVKEEIENRIKPLVQEIDWLELREIPGARTSEDNISENGNADQSSLTAPFGND